MVRTGKHSNFWVTQIAPPICTDEIVAIFRERVMGDLRMQWLVTVHGEIVVGLTYQSKIAPAADTSALDRIGQLIKEL